MKINNQFEVFVFTYNRAQLLRLTLESLLKQTYSNFKITILDNGSTDSTQSVVSKIIHEHPNKQIVFKTVERNKSVWFNFKRAQKLASKKFVMLCHDDDIYHPKYFEKILPFLEREDVNLIASSSFPTKNPETEKWFPITGKYFELTKSDLALHCLIFDTFCYPSTFYRTSVFKKYKEESSLYGKIGDRAFLLNIIKNKKAILLKDKYIHYRIHEGSDSNNISTGPFLNQVLNLLLLYKKCIWTKNSSFFKILYHLFIYDKLFSFYNWSLSNLNWENVLVQAKNQKIIIKTDIFLSQRFHKLIRKIRNLLKKIFVFKIEKERKY